MANIPDSPITRKEKYLDAIANGTTEVPEPITREEEYLAWIALNGGGGGGTGEVTGVKGSAESTFRKGNVSISPANIGLDKVNNTSDLNKPVSTPQQAALDLKVDKVDGKGLSDNNYSDDDKAIVDGVETELAKKVNKVTGKGLSTNDYTNDDKAIVDGVTAALADKVDKVQGKGLSTNDYTDTDKAEVAKIADKADADDVIDGASYDSENHLILFKNGSTTLFSLDAAAFVKDGMVDTVEITGGNLVITFNTDAGKQAISIPLTDIFDPANYYNKTATDNLLADKADKSTVIQFKTTTETDADNLWEENGYYVVNTSDMSHLPTTDVSMGYCLEVIRYGSFSNALVVQIAYRGNPTTESPMYMRRRFNDVWTDWIAIAKKSDVTGKADKVTSAVSGNFAGLDSNGNLTDSGKKAADFQPVIPEAFTGDLNTLSARGFHQYTAAYADLSNAPTVSYTVNKCYIDVWSDGAGNVCQIIKLVGLTYDPATKYCDIFKRSCYSTGSALSWGAWEKQNGKTDKVTSATAGNLAGLDADGNITDSSISPASVASKSATVLTSSDDLNNVTTPGFYYTANTDNPSNIPSGTNLNNNIIEVIKQGPVSRCVQIFYSINGQKMWFRIGNSVTNPTSWSSWELIAFGSLATKADLISSPTADNLVAMDANGNIKDSGKSASDFAKPTDISYAVGVSRRIQVRNEGSGDKYYLIAELTLASNSFTFPYSLKGSIGRYATTDKIDFDIIADFRVGSAIKGYVSSPVNGADYDIICTEDGDTKRIYLYVTKTYSYVDVTISGQSGIVTGSITYTSTMSGMAGAKLSNITPMPKTIQHTVVWNEDLNLDTNKGGNILQYGNVYLVTYWFKATGSFTGNTPIIKLPKTSLVCGNYVIAENNDTAIWGGRATKDGDSYISISCPITEGNSYRAQCVFIDTEN